MRLAVTGLGMVTSVGWGAVGSCAAIRAGITRPRGVPYFPVLDDEEQVTEPLTGHPIAGLTEGFQPVGLWVRLAEASVRDLLSGGDLHDSPLHRWEGTGLILVTSPVTASRFALDADIPPQRVAELLGGRLVGAASLSGQPELVLALTLGHVGTARAVLEARDWLDRGLVERVLVVAVDSYLDPLTLAWLSARRLKTGENPHGLAPGEAAACILLESGQSPSRESLAWIRAAGVGQEAGPQPSETPNQAIALAQVLAGVLPPGPFLGDIVSDLNGEPWRSRELGYLQVRLGERLRQGQLIVPAVSVGEVGAASGAMGVGIAVQSYARGYATDRRSIVLSMSEYGHVGAMYLTA